MKVRLLCVLLLSAVCAYAQKVTVKRVELAGEKIIVHYDLEDSNPNNEYQILLYSSQSNFNTALTKVKGDVGNEVKPGADKKIEWSIREELGPYKGRLSLEVRGKQFVPVAKFTNITTATKMKRGKNHTITWKPGNSNPVTIEFLNGGQQINAVANQPNNGSYTLFISKHQSKGKDYIIRITDSRNSQDVAISKPFTVTPKVPLLLKIVPVLAIGGIVAVLAGSGGGGEDPATNNGEIPVPELPGN
jgi:Ser-Thr-rich glycosyl-phosphatidyl-inositol-anchored membrane family